MRFFWILLIPITLQAVEQVAPRELVINQSTAQTESITNYNQCLNDSLYGKKDGECAGLDPESQAAVNLGCTGSILSGLNAPKKSVCKIKFIICWKWGHKSLTQAGWTLNQQRHLNNAQSCIGNRDTSGNNAHNMNGLSKQNDSSNSISINHANGSAHASGVNLNSFYDPSGNPLFDADSNFIGKDGSKGFGYKEGEMFNRLRNGESFKDLALNSPMAKSLTPDEFKHFKDSLDVPNLQAEFMNGKGSDSKLASQESGDFNLEDTSVATPGTINFQPDNMVDAKSTNKNPSDTKEKSLRNPASSYKEKTIFDQVSNQYQKKNMAMKSVEDYFREKSQEMPKDLRAVIQNH